MTNASPAARDLSVAVRALAGRGPQRERLYHAYAFTLSRTAPDTLPENLRDDFAIWQGELAAPGERLLAHLETLTDEKVDSLVRTIVRLHEAL